MSCLLCGDSRLKKNRDVSVAGWSENESLAISYCTLIPRFTSQPGTLFLNSSTAAGVTLVCQR